MIRGWGSRSASDAAYFRFRFDPKTLPMMASSLTGTAAFDPVPVASAREPGNCCTGAASVRHHCPVSGLQFFQHLGADLVLKRLLVGVRVFAYPGQDLLMTVPFHHLAVAISAADEGSENTGLLRCLKRGVDDLIAVLVPGKHLGGVQTLVEKSLLELFLLERHGAGRIEVRIGRRLMRLGLRLNSALDFLDLGLVRRQLSSASLRRRASSSRAFSADWRFSRSEVSSLRDKSPC